MNKVIRPGCVVSGPTLPERVEVLATVPMGESIKIIGCGQKTGLTDERRWIEGVLARKKGLGL